MTNADRTEAAAVAGHDGMFGVAGGGDTSGYSTLARTVRLPDPSPRPYGGWFDQAADELARVLLCAGVSYESAVEGVVVQCEELTFLVRRDYLPAVATALRDAPKLRFELCCGVSGVHFPLDSGRELHAVYHFLSITHNRRVRIEVACPDADARVPSIVPIYPTNDWHERETYDFFGIVFEGHPGLTRIQLPDDWQGHPQRKDYPLGGIPVDYPDGSVQPPDERRWYR